MKKVFAVLAFFLTVFALVLAACDNGDTGSGGETNKTTLQIKNESSKTLTNVRWSDVVFFGGNSENSSGLAGIWEVNVGRTYVELTISAGSWVSSTWTLVFDSGIASYNGDFTFLGGGDDTSRQLNMGKTKDVAKVSLSGSNLTLSVTNIAGRNGTYQLKRRSNQFLSGNSLTKPVEHGSGYIFFKVNSVGYRTNTLVTVGQNEDVDFIFINTTLVVNTSDSTNTTLQLGEL